MPFSRTFQSVMRNCSIDTYDGDDSGNLMVPFGWLGVGIDPSFYNNSITEAADMLKQRLSVMMEIANARRTLRRSSSQLLCVTKATCPGRHPTMNLKALLRDWTGVHDRTLVVLVVLQGICRRRRYCRASGGWRRQPSTSCLDASSGCRVLRLLAHLGKRVALSSLVYYVQ